MFSQDKDTIKYHKFKILQNLQDNYLNVLRVHILSNFSDNIYNLFSRRYKQKTNP